VPRIPADPATPSPTQPCNRAPWLGREPQSALEAVLLIGLVGRSAPRALRRLERIGALLLGGRGRDAHCYSSQLSGFAPLFSSSGAAALRPAPFAAFSAALPQRGQKPASAGSGWPQFVHETTACSPTGLPQFAQKCEPQMTGAPHSQRLAVVRRPAAAAASIESSSWSRASRLAMSRACSLSRSSRNCSRRYISIASPPRSRSKSSRAL